jgi:hypothetical protein
MLLLQAEVEISDSFTSKECLGIRELSRTEVLTLLGDLCGEGEGGGRKKGRKDRGREGWRDRIQLRQEWKI